MSRKPEIDEEIGHLDEAIQKCNEIEFYIQANLTQIASMNTRYALSYPYADAKFEKEMRNLGTLVADKQSELDSSSSSSSSLNSSASCTSLNHQEDDLNLCRSTPEILKNFSRMNTETIKIKREIEKSLNSLEHKMKLYDVKK